MFEKMRSEQDERGIRRVLGIEIEIKPVPNAVPPVTGHSHCPQNCAIFDIAKITCTSLIRAGSSSKAITRTVLIRASVIRPYCADEIKLA